MYESKLLMFIIIGGWNLIGFQNTDADESFTGVPRFGTLTIETFTLDPFIHSSDFSIGGNFQGSTVNGSFSGIINKIWYKPSAVNVTTFMALYNFPSNLLYLILRLSNELRLFRSNVS